MIIADSRARGPSTVRHSVLSNEIMGSALASAAGRSASWRSLVWVFPGLLLLAAAVVWLTGGGRFIVGPLTVSASSASRLAFEAAVAAAAIQAFQSDRSHLFGATLCVALAMCAAADSNIRRVGDGLEYLVMARNITVLAPPSVTTADLHALQTETRRFNDDSWQSGPGASFRGRYGRDDLTHFWMFPAIAAPFVAAARAVGVHPAAGFTAFNVACLFALCVVLAKRAGYHVALLVVCGVLWWVDKAHPEILIVTGLALGLLWLESRPVASALVFALVAAHMPVFLPMLVASLVLLLARTRTALALTAALLCCLIAGLHPLYYLWNLGRVSPLQDVATLNTPGIRALVTPLLDPNLGVIWYASALIGLAGVGVAARGRGSPRILLLALLGIATLLLSAAQTSNINHGGTPGPTRYGIWCLGLLVPLALWGADRMTSTRPRVVAVATVLTLVFAALVLHPRHQDAGIGPHPSALARMVWNHAPGLDNPLPEVFAERITHIDGAAPVPVATDGCQKALLAGDGRVVWWPRHCQPRSAPAICASQGMYCYANGTEIVPAPRQAGFAAALAADRWTLPATPP
jgi:hypothetical protein